MPLPRWIGFLSYLVGVFAIGLLVIGWNAGLRPRRWALSVLAFFGVLLACFFGGTLILMGKTGYEKYETDDSGD
jgi:hypothetical protein